MNMEFEEKVHSFYKERSFFSAILNQAIADGVLVKNPRSPHIRKLTKNITCKNSKNMIRNEDVAYSGRSFLNNKIWFFRFLCNSLDIDPIYLEKKCTEYFKKYDEDKVKKIVLGS